MSKNWGSAQCNLFISSSTKLNMPIAAASTSCALFIGQFDGPNVNATEVSAYRWVDPAQLNRELGDR